MPRVGLAAGFAVIAAAGTLVAPVALASTSHVFTASYTGHGAGKVSGTEGFGEREVERPWQDHRTGHTTRLGTGSLRQSNLHRLQRQGRA